MDEIQRGDDPLGKFLFNMLMSWVSTSILMVAIDELADIFKGNERTWKKRWVKLGQRTMAPFYFGDKAISIFIDITNTIIDGKYNSYATEMAFETILNTYYKAFGKNHAVVKNLEQQIKEKFKNIRES